jgi:hypothetical protein
MKKTGGLLPGWILLTLSWGCASGVAPITLYGGPPRPPAEISVIRIVKTHPRYGHPTLNVRKITRLEDPWGVVFEVTPGSGWQIPGHFAGPPDTQRGPRQGDPRDYPSEFRLLPGLYQVDFRYVPATDRWGWTHGQEETSTVRLTCTAGMVHLLEGILREDGQGFVLDMRQEGAGAGGVSPR